LFFLKPKNYIPHLLQNAPGLALVLLLLALAHGFILVKKDKLIFSDPKIFDLFTGVSTFTIFTLLAITSNGLEYKAEEELGNCTKLNLLSHVFF